VTVLDITYDTSFPQSLQADAGLVP